MNRLKRCTRKKEITLLSIEFHILVVFKNTEF